MKPDRAPPRWSNRPDDDAAYKVFSLALPHDPASHSCDFRMVAGLRLCGAPAPARSPLMQLVAKNLVCRRGNRAVFAGLSFSVASGEAVLVVGPNGAGKSSLLRMIAGLLRVADGELSLIGGDGERSIAEQCHYLGHQDALKSSLSVAENLDFWTHYLGGRADAMEALAAVGLESLADLPAGYLSAGQRRRLSIARLVAVERTVWLLDEPTSALDAASQTRLVAIMSAHLGRGGIIVAATHGPIGLGEARELRIGGEA